VAEATLKDFLDRVGEAITDGVIRTSTVAVRWYRVKTSTSSSGQRGVQMTTEPGDLLGADTSELTMLGRRVQRLEGERPQLECFTTRTALSRETHRTSEWVSLSPVPPHRPDVYQVVIVYAPRDGRIVEAKSLREYGLSFKTTQASAAALARQVAGDVLAATRARWVQVNFQNTRSGEGARVTTGAGDDQAQAETQPPGIPGRPAERARAERPQLQCVTAEDSATGGHESLERLHETRSWVSQSPVPPFLTDIYHVTVAYAPRDGRVLEPSSLWEYAASFSETGAFAEALAGQVAHDVLAATRAHWVRVTFVQHVRGGWEIEAVQRLDADEAEPKQSR
jgi:NADPH-dependent 7-cyano-7-deazaguanine reductase QueF